MPRLSRKERLIALGMIQANMNYSQVARHFGCSRTAIRNLVERHAETGSVDDRPRPGRERVTTPEQDRCTVILSPPGKNITMIFSPPGESITVWAP